MRLFFLFLFVAAAVTAWAATPREASAPALATADGWTSGTPRQEIAPSFAYFPTGGPSGSPRMVIETDKREGLDGYWTRTIPIEGGKWYELRAWRRMEGAQWPQQSGMASLRWLDAKGQVAQDDRKLVSRYLNGFNATAPLEYPLDGETRDGWTELRGLWQAPGEAREALVKLHLRWTANAKAEWSAVTLEQVPAPQPRTVRLATIHLQPSGATPAANREQFAPLIERAAAQKADLVVLPETLTYYGKKLTPAEAAEPIPGPSTEYFGQLAKKHNLYIVAGLYERDRHIVYNVAVLLAPDGKLQGKYRKVTLPDNEAESGVTPGVEYPVFETRFGKLGMMVCYDGFFPEVARELTKGGAEVIAWPVWGANPDLAEARAAENHVYLISSTYEDISRNWMYSAVWDHTGHRLVTAKDWGTVVVAEVDLNETTRWRSLGDFRSKLQRHVPMTPAAGGYRQ